MQYHNYSVSNYNRYRCEKQLQISRNLDEIARRWFRNVVTRCVSITYTAGKSHESFRISVIFFIGTNILQISMSDFDVLERLY